MSPLVAYVPYRPNLAAAALPARAPVRLNRVITPYGRFRGLGALGANEATGAAVGAAQGAAAGAVAGPIGAAVGAVVGAAMSLFGHQSNPQIQADKNTAISLFAQYVNVMGSVSGRSIGVENMDFVWRGAAFQGHFPAWQNNTGWIDTVFGLFGKTPGGNCFGPLWKAALTGNPAPGYPGTGNGGVPVRDAKTFVDRYFVPSNSAGADTNPWATNTDSVGMQIIYDSADAYIATITPSTAPFISSSYTAPAPTPAMSSSSGSAPLTTDGSQIAPGSSRPLQNSQGINFSFGTQANAGGYPMLANGSPVSTYAGVAMKLMNGGTLYLQDSSGAWWQWGGNALTKLGSPPVQGAATSAATSQPQTVLTADNSTVGPGGNALRNAQGQTFWLGATAVQGGYPLYANGSVQGTYAGVGLALMNGGTLYLQDSSGAYWQWTGSALTKLTAAPVQGAAPAASSSASTPAAANATPVAPAAPTSIEATDGSTVTAPGAALETPAGTIVYFGAQAPNDPNNQYGMPMWEVNHGGSPQQNGYGVGLIMGNGGNIYAVNQNGNWFQWGANNWSALPAAPSLTNAAQPSNTGVGTNIQTATGASGTPVATTPAGSTVTAADIASMVNQMAAQSASQQQAYNAIMTALQQQGATVTSALQSQVAGAVTAAIPQSAPAAASVTAPTTAAGGSHTGLLLVGGGLAVAGVLWWLGRRR
jgi:hypothetical protein